MGKTVDLGMAITVNIYYLGESGSAREFAREMEASGIAADIRNEKGNLKYSLSMSAERYGTDETGFSAKDKKYMREK